VSLLEEQAGTRVPELVPIRYGRMLVSPFAFYRGAAAIMASDLAGTPQSGIRAQLCGDAHLSNFGGFASPERRLMFDINDFDETLPGPWEWDVTRLAASLAVAGRSNGFSEGERSAVILRAAGAYRERMRTFAQMRNLDVWYSSVDVEKALDEYRDRVDARLAARADKAIAKGRTRDSMQAFEKLTHVVDGEVRIVSDPPLLVPVEELFPAAASRAFGDTVAQFFDYYGGTLVSDRRHLLHEFRFVHLARKVVGVGSVGTRAWIALFLGRDDGDPLFLQIKEAQASVLEPYVGKGEHGHHGERVIHGQRLMQAASDIFLGWHRTEGIDGIERDFYVRQLRDWKTSAEIEAMVPQGMAIYAGWCGGTLARAHARSGDRIAIASYLGSGDAFDRAMVAFAEAYADQNERDYAALAEAVKAGRIEAEAGL
jgi:uncharacterized protein (DUF2252 family)